MCRSCRSSWLLACSSHLVDQRLLEESRSDKGAHTTDPLKRHSGVEVSELFHRDESGLAPGPEPQRRSYRTYASFAQAGIPPNH